MPKMDEIKKVLVIGSGPIVIGQAAEFDYAGTQACRSLKEEGMEVKRVQELKGMGSLYVLNKKKSVLLKDVRGEEIEEQLGKICKKI